MSSAFTKDSDNGGSLPDVGERPISPHRNLVTANGLAMIDAEIAFLHEALAAAEASGDREQVALNSRDLRYWIHRRETAELSTPEPDSDVVRFGMSVELQSLDKTKKAKWLITGEDEADAKHGKISHVSPMAIALFGKKVGDVVSSNGHDWQILTISSDLS
jgi:transcription elongation GreA/GreB family factor